MEKENKFHDISTTELRNELKNIVAKQIQKLPEYIEKLDNEQRIEFLLKLFPFVFPKINNVRYEQGDPTEFKTIRYT